jgi:hypothetical protein
MPGTFPDCPTCTNLFSSCAHRAQYQTLEKHIAGLGLAISIADPSKTDPDKTQAGLSLRLLVA